MSENEKQYLTASDVEPGDFAIDDDTEDAQRALDAVAAGEPVVPWGEVKARLAMTSLERGERPITVGQLRAWLAHVPDDAPIVMSKDAEGNGFSPLAEAESDARYVPESTWAGYVPCSDEDDPEGTERVVMLWPTN